MAVFTNTQAKGNRESLADVIKDISPEDFPALSNVGKGKAYATREDWQTDALTAGNKDNAVLEGADSTLPALTATTLLSNHVQDFEISFAISNVQEKVRKAGRKSEVSYQVEKAFRQLKTDVEASITQNNAAVARIAGTTAGKSASLETFAWAINNTASATGAHGTGTPNGSTTVVTSGAPTTAPVDSGTTRAFTEAQLKATLADGFSKGARYKMALMPFAQKQVMAGTGFPGVAGTRLNMQIGKKEMGGIIGAVDVYVSDAGAIMLTPDAHMRTKTVILLDPECVQTLWLQDYEHEVLAPTGPYTKHRVGCNMTLKVSNPRGVAKIADLT